MLNVEKYKEEIKDLIKNKKGNLCGIKKLYSNEGCWGISCSDCRVKTIEWLVSECKEPILTDKEKELIKAIIELFNENWLISIEWFETIITSKICICAREKEDRTIVETLEIPTLLFKESMFQGLEKNREYTIEELGL